jgi:hypothetical protein
MDEKGSGGWNVETGRPRSEHQAAPPKASADAIEIASRALPAGIHTYLVPKSRARRLRPRLNTCVASKKYDHFIDADIKEDTAVGASGGAELPDW